MYETKWTRCSPSLHPFPYSRQEHYPNLNISPSNGVILSLITGYHFSINPDNSIIKSMRLVV